MSTGLGRMKSWLILAAVLTALSLFGQAISSAQASDEPRRGGTMYIVRDADSETLDPQYATGLESATVMSHLYDTLVVLDYDMETIHPHLAKSWEITDDRLEYRFYLRDDVKFHSGKPLVAEDVVATFNRWRDPAKASVTGHYLANVEEVYADDHYTVVLRMSAPNNLLMENLTMPFAGIMNAEKLEEWGDDYGSLYVDGTGPFKLVEWISGDTLTVERFDEYTWGPEMMNNRGPAYLDRIVWRVVPEAGTRSLSVETGEAHAMRSGGVIHQYEVLKANPNLRVIPYNVLNTRFGAFKIAKPHLSDVRVRRAINHAVDQQLIVDVIEWGLALPAYGFLHPQTRYAWPEIDNVAYEYNPELANKLLDEAGWTMGPDGVRYKDGMPLRVEVYLGHTNEEEVTLIKDDLRRVGVDLVINLVARAALYDIRRTEIPDLNWIYVPYENADILYFYFHSEQQPSPNRFNFAHEEVDRLLELTRTSPDEDEIREAYYEIQRIIHEEALALPVVHRQNFIALRNTVKDFTVHSQYDIAFYKMLDVWLDQ